MHAFQSEHQKKQLKLTLDCFIILNSNFFLLQINDYIKVCFNTNILFNISLTNLLFGKKVNFLLKLPMSVENIIIFHSEVFLLGH